MSPPAGASRRLLGAPHRSAVVPRGPAVIPRPVRAPLGGVGTSASGVGRAPAHDTVVFVPAYNEQETIASVVEDVREHVAADVIVIDDGSVDETGARARHAGARVIRLPYNNGIGAAHQTGFLYARRHGYAFVGQLDADGQHRAADLARLLEVVRADDADLMIGSRFGTGGEYVGTGARRAGIRVFSRLIRAFTGERISDVTSGLRAGNRRVVLMCAERYPSDYAEIEILHRALRSGLRCGELPVHMRHRQAGVSHITPLRSCYYVAKVTLMLCIGAVRPRDEHAER